jgi:glycerate kinase
VLAAPDKFRAPATAPEVADRNDPWAATTRGTGELIAAAVAEDARRVIVGLGGSATTDGGLGAFQELITDPRWDLLRNDRSRPKLIVCCDVRTTFATAANIFGPQKGADRRMVADLRQRLLDLEGRYLTGAIQQVVRDHLSGTAAIRPRVMLR